MRHAATVAARAGQIGAGGREPPCRSPWQEMQSARPPWEASCATARPGPRARLMACSV